MRHDESKEGPIVGQNNRRRVPVPCLEDLGFPCALHSAKRRV